MKRPVCTAGGWTMGAVAVLVVACRVYGIGQYSAAAVLAGTAVGATAAHRSVTGGCWAVCSHGWHCDRDSGLCVPMPRPQAALDPVRTSMPALCRRRPRQRGRASSRVRQEPMDSKVVVDCRRGCRQDGPMREAIWAGRRGSFGVAGILLFCYSENCVDGGCAPSGGC